VQIGERFAQPTSVGVPGQMSFERGFTTGFERRQRRRQCIFERVLPVVVRRLFGVRFFGHGLFVGDTSRDRA
jgi:hypothetical protein